MAPRRPRRRWVLLAAIWLAPYLALGLARYGFDTRNVGEFPTWVLPLAGVQLIATLGVAESRRARLALLAAAAVPYALYFAGIVPGFAAAASVLPQTCIAVVMALSLWIPFASGQLSLAQAGFMAIGAYGSAWLTTRLAWPFAPALFVGAGAAALFGLVVSYPALRLRGIYLAVATLGLGEVIRIFFLNFEPTGSAFGFTGIPKRTETWHLLAAVALISAMLYSLMRSRVGRAMSGVRLDGIAASTVGISVTRIRVLSFTMGAFLAGLGGGFYAHYTTFVEPDAFGLGSLVEWLAMVMFGGLQTFVGPIVGSFVLSTLPEVLRFLADYRLMMNGVILVVLLIFRPDGVISRDLVAGSRVLPGRSLRARPPEPVAATATRLAHPDSGPPAAAGDPPLLSIEGVTKVFGGLTAIDDVDLVVRRAQIFGLIGPNGAGKTTLFNVLTGLYAVNRGTITLNGTAIHDHPPHEIARLGISRTFQNIRLFREMSVLENVLLGRYLRTRAGALRCALGLARSEERLTRSRGLELLELTGIAEVAHARADSLPYGDQRRLEIARALATDPQILLLDEPAAGMNRGETEQLEELVRRLRREVGITVLLIEHDIQLVMNVCELVAVLNFGRKIAEGRPEEVQNDPGVIEAYLGTRDDEAAVIREKARL